MQQEKLFYDKLTEPMIAPLQGLKPEDLIPTKGTVLIALIPVKERIGSILLPAVAQSQDPMARVVAVPDDPLCPVKPGDWIIFHNQTHNMVALEGREDIARVGYSSDGGPSDIVLILPREKYEKLRVDNSPCEAV